MLPGAAAQAPITDQICHYAGITVRVTGSGQLRPSWHTLDAGKSKTLAPIPLPWARGKFPFRLGGFTAQRAALRIEMTAVNEHFAINRVILWCAPLWTGYPG